jgi:hypothetical protein
VTASTAVLICGPLRFQNTQAQEQQRQTGFAAMERRIREWVVGRNDIGRAVLEWQGESHHPEQVDDIEATWADLDVSALRLEDESQLHDSKGFNPYDRRPAVPLDRKRFR